MTMKHGNPISMGWSKSSSKREIYGNTIPPEETRNISNKQLTLHLKQLEKEEHKNPIAKEHTFLSTLGTFSRIDQILSHK